MSKIGYARVSTEEQNLHLQHDALNRAGCDDIFEDVGISAVAKSRPGFEQALEHLKPGDVFIIWKMDRAFRSLKHAITTLELFEERNVEFCSLTDHIDTTTPIGKCMYQVSNAFAEFERSLISERTKAGLKAARQRGVKLGRPRKLGPVQIVKVKALLESDDWVSIVDVAGLMRVSPRTISRALRG